MLYIYIQEVLIKGLAESRTFQRFALRTHVSIQEFKKDGAENLNSKLDAIHKAANDAAYYSTSTGSRGSSNQYVKPPEPPLTGVAGFVSAFAKEVRKDLGIK